MLLIFFTIFEKKNNIEVIYYASPYLHYFNLAEADARLLVCI